MYEVRASLRAQSQIKKLPQKIRKAVVLVLIDFKEDPYIGYPLGRELTGQYAYKIGSYRIVYKIRKKDKIVEILKVMPRPVVYN